MSAAELAASPAVLISENYWHERFAQDPDIVGKIIRLNGASFAIAGVTPSNFTGTSIAVPNFWLPLSLYPSVYPHDRRLRDREYPCCRIFGRLAPGVTMQEAQAEATVLASRVRALHDPTSELSRPTSVVISPGSPLPGINSTLRLTIALMLAATTMVLLIACANAAGLQLARTTARQQELGMRLSLGASRSRLIRQLLTESALLGVLAGATALPVTWALMRLAVIKVTEQLPLEFTLVVNVTPDGSVFACVLALSVLAGLAFGLAPALASSRSALFFATRSRGASLRRGRLRHGRIAVQVAVSVTLRIAGGLLLAASFSAAIASSIGLFGLLLASMGIYSTVSYDVVLRTREVGIRMAIGAQKHDILTVVMHGSLRAVLVGLAAGVVLASGAARLLRGVLYGLGALDLMSFAAASSLFLAIAVASSWIASRRAMRIDPLVALREQ